MPARPSERPSRRGSSVTAPRLPRDKSPSGRARRAPPQTLRVARRYKAAPMSRLPSLPRLGLRKSASHSCRLGNPRSHEPVELHRRGASSSSVDGSGRRRIKSKGSLAASRNLRGSSKITCTRASIERRPGHARGGGARARTRAGRVARDRAREPDAPSKAQHTGFPGRQTPEPPG